MENEMKVMLRWTHPANGLFGDIADLSQEDAEITKKQMERDGCYVELVNQSKSGDNDEQHH